MSITRDVYDPLMRFCIAADTPICLGVYLRIKYGEWDSLVELEVRPEWYLHAYAYFIDRQAACWLAKYQNLPTSFDRTQRAVDAFVASERRCKTTNDRLSRFLENGPFDESDDKIADVIKEIRAEIARIIGHQPPAPEYFFGPGATMSDRDGDYSVPFKICSKMTITNSATWLIPSFAKTAWGRYGQKVFETIECNRFTTAVKNAKIHRGIEIQASVNVAAQLGYGRCLRRKLRNKTPIDIKQAKPLHQNLAEKASIDESLVTLDLKSASDTICKNLVKLLLPPEWYSLLFSLTTRKLAISEKDVDGAGTYVLERFSAMGCGFTFELETLVFYAICKTVSRHKGDVRVFGDDIIVHKDDTRGVIAALSYFGFEINREKSFTQGYFRESCGGDFFSGFAVRPFYLKETPCEPQHWISYANGVLRASRQIAPSIGATPFLKSWIHIQDQIPASIRRARGPDYFGDLLLHDDEEKHNFKVVNGIKRYLVYSPDKIKGTRWSQFCGSTQLAAALYGCRLARVWPTLKLKDALEGVPVRDGVLTYSLATSPDVSG